jgi:DNA-binding CsgD family transcriptional regulator
VIAIEDIYDAAFDRTRFPALLERLTKAFNARASFIGWSDAGRDAGFQAQYGNEPAWLQSYVETYGAHDILRPHLHAMPEGVPGSVWPFLQKPEIRESIFYREFIAPQGLIDTLAVNLIKRPNIVAHFALHRHAPSEPFSEEDTARLSKLVPHLRRAIYVQSHLVRAADLASSERSFAGGANSALLLLASDGVLLEADIEIAQLLRLRIGERLGEGPLRLSVDAAIRSGEPVAIELQLADEAQPTRLLLEARPLDINRFGDLTAGPGASHAVHVTRVDQSRNIAYEAMGSLYGLTATEVRVLRDAVETGDLTAIGDRLGMARATARTHLHRTYEKTGTRSFAGLANLAHRFGRITRR